MYCFFRFQQLLVETVLIEFIAALAKIINIHFYSPSCLDQETAKGPFGLRVMLSPAHLSITNGGGFTLALLMLNVKQKSYDYQFL